MLRRARLVVLALAAAGCAHPTLERAPTEPLERAIFLREAAGDGWHGISHHEVETMSVARVVDPALVDLESRLEIRPDAERLGALAGDAAPGARLRLEAFLERAGKDPVPLHLPDYDSVDRREVRTEPRPLEELLPTRLDLARTIAQVGDRVTVRSTLLDAAGAPLLPAGESRFRLQQLGWHSAYHPSVVLARPFERETADASFRFTPGVSWLHAYTPRHDEEGRWATWMRITSMAMGPHALLLQFDSEQEVEIGLGATVGFWDGVLQFGVGLNLMADDGADREYFYVGSSLIPLAQAVQRGFNSTF